MIRSRYRHLADGALGLLTFQRADCEPRHHLLCFPHGGGGPQSFAKLAERLPSSVAVTAVDPPGRPRTGGEPLTDLGELVDLCAEHLPPRLLDGCVLLGQSVGGYAAAALAGRLERQGVAVRGVVLSAVVPPRFLDPLRPLSRMTDEERYAWCRRMGTLPGEETGSRALFSVFADAIRADCMAFESAGSLWLDHRSPMLVVTGRDDPMCPLAQVRSWTDTHPQAEVRQISGGHLVASDHPGHLARLITRFLETPARRTRSWRREELRLRTPDGSRRTLPVLVPAPGQGRASRLAEILTDPQILAPLLSEHGAVLARGWNVVDPDRLRAIAFAEVDGSGRYAGGNSPCTSLGHDVYTPAEYPADQDICPNNALSYAESGPERIYLACALPAARGGQTPLVDGRTLIDRVPGRVVDELRACGVRYLRRLHGGIGPGKSWQDAFGTTDRDKVADYLVAAGAQAEWTSDGALRVIERRPAFATRPDTGRRVWFNQVERWHSSALPAGVREALRAEFGPDGMPHEATYGDGRPIPDRDIAAVRAAVAGAAVAHGWRRGDLLVVDNLATPHGRSAYQGERRILVTMSGQVRNTS